MPIFDVPWKKEKNSSNQIYSAEMQSKVTFNVSMFYINSFFDVIKAHLKHEKANP